MTKPNTKVAKRSSVRVGHNKGPDVPKMTHAMLVNLFDDEQVKDAAREVATAHRIRGGVLLMLNEPGIGAAWAARWDRLKTLETTKAADKMKAEAKAEFANEFGCSAPADIANESEEHATARNNKYRRVEDTMKFCVAVHRQGLTEAFTFNQAGGSFISNSCSVGAKIWGDMIKKDTNLAQQGATTIQIVDRKTKQSGRISWASLMLALTGPNRVNKPTEGEDNTDTAEKGTMSSKDPVAALNRATGWLVSNNDAIKSDIAKQRTVLLNCELQLKAVLHKPTTNDIWLEFVALFNKLDTTMKYRSVTRAPTTEAPAEIKIEGMEGPTVKNAAEVFKRKGDLKSPDTAKALPHPANPANNKPAVVKTARKVAND